MSTIGRTAVSRADLLSLLIRADEHTLGKIAFSLGYQLKEIKQTLVIEESLPVTINKPDKPESFTKLIERPDNKPSARFFYVAERKRKQKKEQKLKPEIPQWLKHSEILKEDSIPEIRTIALPQCPPLIRWPRIWPFLRTVLGQHYQSNQPDIPRLIDNVARGITVRQLPMQTQHSWSSKICLLLDFNSQTEAYYHDFNELKARLKKIHGELGFEVRILEGEAGLKTHYRIAKENTVLNWQIPALDTPLLILSDLGLLAESPRLQQGWERFGRRLRAAGCRAQVLCPVPESLQNKTLQGLFIIHSWDRNNRLRGQSVNIPISDKADQEQRKQSKGVETLLVLLSVAVVIEPGLLRAVRLLFPVEQVNVADEAGFWQHPDIISSTQGCCFKTLSGVNQYQQQLMTDDFWRTIKLQDNAEQQLFKQRLIRLIQTHHAYLPQSVRMMEMDQCERLLPGTVDQPTLTEIQDWQQAMAKTCYQWTDNDDLQSWNQQYIDSLPLDMLNNPPLVALWALAQKHKLEQGEIIQFPETINKEHVDFILAGEATETHPVCSLFQTGDALKIAEQPANIQLHGSQYANFTLHGDLSIKTEYDQGHVDESIWQWQQAQETFRSGNSKCLVKLDNNLKQITLSNQSEMLLIKSLNKPDWASQIGRDKEGLWVEFEQQGKSWRVYWPAWGGELGYDQHGLYNDLTIKGVVQRSRFIAPGTFLMGSPESEAGRVDDEIQHQVTLTQGYWLADTACTQALWQAVMEGNPAEFKKNENNPVETVSWDDVQTFLKKLNNLVPGLDSQLPTEAQWEYACRAGTSAPFSFGGNITPEQVNYDGKNPYADGKDGLYRGKTVAVKSLLANPWGLYEMHGNVWEWCQDWFGDYSKTTVSDPTGAEKGPYRVLRGGSWIDLGRNTRSADRGRYRSDRRNDLIGFRFAPGQTKSREAEPTVAASERGKHVQLSDTIKQKNMKKQ